MFILLLTLVLAIILIPIILFILYRHSVIEKENMEGALEETINQEEPVLNKDILISRVDARIWDALHRKYGSTVVAYEAMTPYAEGGDMKIVATFTSGRTEILKVSLPLASFDRERKKKEENIPKNSIIEESKVNIVEYVEKELKKNAEAIIPKEMMEQADTVELTNELLFNEICTWFDLREDGSLICGKDRA